MKSFFLTCCVAILAFESMAQFIGPSIEIRARSAETITGPQSNDVAASAAHTTNTAIHLTTEQSARIGNSLTNETDALALAALAEYTPVKLWSDNNRFALLDGGTNVSVYEIVESAYTNYTVTLSSDFEETETHTRPAWTNNVWPFTDGLWTGFSPGTGSLVVLYDGNPSMGWGGYDYTYPAILIPGEDAQGTATVYQHTVSLTNEIFRIPLASITNVTQYLKSGGSATNLDLYSDWQTFADVTGSFALTNFADRPIQCTGTGSVTLTFSGLKSPTPVYLMLGGFSSVSWPSNTYAVGGWGAWQTNRMNHFAVWTVGNEIFVNAITTSEE